VQQAGSIYVRWITAGRTLDHPTISDIPADQIPADLQTTVNALKSMAVDRNY
jgi:hypothetical protein